MTQYKLIYFNLKGLGELARYIFAVADKEYEDHRIEFSDWPKYKEEQLFGQLPVLVINENGKESKLYQSNTIARYLGRKFNLVGRDEMSEARAEMILDHLNDLLAYFRAFFQESDEILKAEKLKKFVSAIPDHLAPVEKILETEKTRYLVGNHLTIADLSLAVTIDRFENHIGNTLDKFPLVKALNQKVSNLPKLLAYKAKRPVTPF